MLSPNHGDRKGHPVDMVVLHYTAMPDLGGAIGWLCDPASQVSCHWVIGRDGSLHKLVPEDRRAWHAGAGRWGRVTDVNSRSVGIELDNDGREPFAPALMAALVSLLRGVFLRHPAIRPERVVGHSCVAPWRKNDPGPRFDWARLAAEGLAIPTPEAPPAPLANLPHDLSTIGFPAGPTPFAVRLRALRLRHRPGAAGRAGRGGIEAPPADEIDAGLARALAVRWPVAGGPDETVSAALDRAAMRA